MKIMGNFCYDREPSRATTKSKLFVISKDVWDTKGDADKSMKNVLYILWFGKTHLSGSFVAT